MKSHFREMIATNGVKSLADHELFSALFPANVAASLNQSGGIGAMRQSDSPYVLAVLELAKRINDLPDGEDDEPLRNPAQAGRYFKRRLRHTKVGAFGVAYLDSRHKVMMFEAGSDEPHPRDVARRCLQLDATAIMLCVLREDGEREPTLEDRARCKKFKQVLESVDLRILDSFIVVKEGDPVSLTRMGWC